MLQIPSKTYPWAGACVRNSKPCPGNGSPQLDSQLSLRRQGLCVPASQDQARTEEVTDA